MKAKKVIRYHCDFCGRGHWKKPSCLEHEERCYHNPEIRACGSCGNNENYYCTSHDKDLIHKHVEGVDWEKDNVHPLQSKNCGHWEANKQ